MDLPGWFAARAHRHHHTAHAPCALLRNDTLFSDLFSNPFAPYHTAAPLHDLVLRVITRDMFVLFTHLSVSHALTSVFVTIGELVFAVNR